MLTEDFSQVLTLLAHDESLTHSFGDVRASVLPYLLRVNRTSHDELLQAQTIAESMESCCALLQDAEDEVRCASQQQHAVHLTCKLVDVKQFVCSLCRVLQ